MPTGTELKDALPDKLKNDVLPAIDELVKVLGGDTANAFDPATVYPASDVADLAAHAAQITNDMQAAPIDADITTNMQKLLKGVPGADAVTSALDKAIDWIETQLKEVSSISGDITERLEAWNKLNTEHPAADYTDPNKLGFIPAIEGVINSVANTNADADDITKPIEDAAAVLAAAGAVGIFSAYALGAMQMLTRARSG